MTKFNKGDRVRFTDKCLKGWAFGPHTKYTEGIIIDTPTIHSYHPHKVEYGNGDHRFIGFVTDEHIELITVKLSVQVGKRYRKDDDYTRPIKVLYVDKQSVFYEVEETGQRRHTGIRFTKNWTEILPEDWRVLYKNSAGDILVSKAVYTNRTAALDDQDHYHQIIDVIRVDDKRPTIQPSA